MYFREVNKACVEKAGLGQNSPSKKQSFARAMPDSTAFGFIPRNDGLNILTTSGEITLLYGFDF